MLKTFTLWNVFIRWVIYMWCLSQHSWIMQLCAHTLSSQFANILLSNWPFYLQFRVTYFGDIAKQTNLQLLIFKNSSIFKEINGTLTTRGESFSIRCEQLYSHPWLGLGWVLSFWKELGKHLLRSICDTIQRKKWRLRSEFRSQLVLWPLASQRRPLIPSSIYCL